MSNNVTKILRCNSTNHWDPNGSETAELFDSLIRRSVFRLWVGDDHVTRRRHHHNNSNFVIEKSEVHYLAWILFLKRESRRIFLFEPFFFNQPFSLDQNWNASVNTVVAFTFHLFSRVWSVVFCLKLIFFSLQLPTAFVAFAPLKYGIFCWSLSPKP